LIAKNIRGYINTLIFLVVLKVVGIFYFKNLIFIFLFWVGFNYNKINLNGIKKI